MGATAPASDDEPCRICDDMKDFLAQRGFKLPSSRPQSNQEGETANAADLDHKTRLEPVTDHVQGVIVECPLDRATLGRYSWAMLHTMAAYYPVHPSKTDQVAMTEFMHRFAQFYPCATCARHLRQDLSRYPPETGTRHLLSNWMCQLHNRVNRRLGKELFDCDKVDERWRTGPPC